MEPAAAAAAFGIVDAAAVSRTAALALVLAGDAAADGGGYDDAALPALVSGNWGRRKAQSSHCGQSSKPRLRGTWAWICTRSNSHHSCAAQVRVRTETGK